ncbi:enoyl-CoA hydratase [Corynebacterium glyciniphilum]|uniref:enoyl-CoA hydratase n=1 Tax=Corynebacterium glyciniphilum TaxID=1404244 RepID=UPI003DA00E73
MAEGQDAPVNDGIRVARDEGVPAVGVITLCRPDRRNALDADVCGAVADAVEEFVTAGDPVRVILLRAEGPAFCAGANLKGGVYATDFFSGLERMIRAISEAPVPIIADVQGPAVGAGCQLVLACDLRVMGPKARVWVPAVHHGFSLDRWTVQRAVELLGGSVARNVLIAGAQVGQSMAVANGFAMLGGPSHDALELARTMSRQAPMPMHYFKLAMNNPDPDSELAGEIDRLGGACWLSRDVTEARRAREEKRAPIFEGR